MSDSMKAINVFLKAGEKYAQARKTCIATLCPINADKSEVLLALKTTWIKEKNKSPIPWDSSNSVRNALQYLFKGIAAHFGYQNVSTVHWSFTGSVFAEPKTVDAKPSLIGQNAQINAAHAALVQKEAQCLISNMDLPAQVAALIKAFGLAAVISEIQNQAANVA
jgi:hypothetical protein